MRNNYENRIRASGWVSGVLHVLALLLAWWLVPAVEFGASKTPDGPITVTLAPPDPEPTVDRPLVRQLVDVAAPATAPVQPTDLIAVENSNAADAVSMSGDRPGPKVDVEDTIDSLGGRAGTVPTPQTPPAAESAPTPPQPTEKPAEKPEEAPKTPEKAPEEPSPASAPAPQTMTIAKASPATEKPAAEAPTSAAQASAPAPQPGPTGNNRPDDSQTRGRRYNGVQKVGVQGFEALQDQIAPYLKQVEEAVERRWREALLTKYAGSRATEAEIDCEIGPDGRIVSLKINGTPDDRVYAALCKEAIEKAGPFGPFPFTVPEIYRNRNLEIRWSFNFS